MREKLFQFPAHLLLVFCGLFGSVFCLIDGFGLTVDREPLFWWCAAAAVGFTALFSLKKPAWKGLILLAAAAALGLWGARHWESICNGAAGLAYHIQRAYGTLYVNFPIPSAPKLPAAALEEGETAILLLAAVLLGCYLAWGTVSLRTFWSGAAVTALFLVPVLGADRLPHIAPLTALLLFYCVGLLTRLAGKTDAQGGAKQIYLSLPLAAALLLALRAALPTADYRPSAWAEERRDELTGIGVRVGEALVSGDIANIPQAVVGGPSTTVDLSAAGPLNFTGRTVLRVTSPYSGRIYLRGWSSGRYDGSKWAPLEAELYETYLPDLTGTGEAWSDIGGWQPMNFPAASAELAGMLSDAADPDGGTRRVEVEQLQGERFLYIPYHLATTPGDMTGGTFRRDEYVERKQGYQSYVFLLRPEAAPSEHSWLPASAEAAEEQYRRLVYAAYTDLPAGYDAGALLEDFMDWRGTAPLGDRTRLVKEVAAYLAARCEYDPRTPYTPSGEDFVAYFLNESRTGYCMHFASAATVLLRAMGVPARYTAGYVADAVEGVTVHVPDRASHAWVEVYFDGYGWQPFEVTPGFDGALPWVQRTEAQATPSPTPTPTVTPVTTPPPLPTPAGKPSLPPVAESTPTPGQTGGGTAEPLPPWVMWALCGALALGAVGSAELLRRRWVAWRRRARFVRAASNRAVISAYRDLERILGWTGAPVDGALLALAQKAKFSSHVLTEEERTAFLQGVSAAAAETCGALSPVLRPFFRYVHGGWL